MEQVIFQFTNEIKNQYKKSELESSVWSIVLKIFSLYFSMEMPRYSNQLLAIATREMLRTGNPALTKKIILELMQKLEEIVPDLKGVLLDKSLENYDEQNLYKIILSFERYGLKSGEYKNESSVVQFFNALVDEYLTSKKIVDITPKELIELMIESIKPLNGSVYDGTAGIANILVYAYDFAKKKNGIIKVFGQELNDELYKIGKLNLFINNIIPSHGDLKLGDTIQKPKWIENGRVKQFDYVLMNYSFGINDWGYDFAIHDPFGRFDFYGIPSKSQGDYAFIIHALSSLNRLGKAALIVPFGALVRGASERKIRSVLLKDDVIETIVSLPDNLFAGTGIQVALLILNKNKSVERKGKVQFINAENDFSRTRTMKFLENKHIKKIVNAIEAFENEKGYSKIVLNSEIEENQFDLNPSLYFEEIEMETEFGKVEFNRKEYKKRKNLVRIGEIAEVIRGVNLPGKQQVDSVVGEYYPVIQIRDIEEGKILFNRIEHFPIKTRDIDRVTAKFGDILVASRGTQQKIAVVPRIEDTILVSSMFVIIRILSDVIEPEYIKRILESPIGQYYFEANQSGSVVTVLTPNDIKGIEIPLLSLEEQKNFVKELKEADELVKNAQEMRKNKFITAYSKITTSAKFLN